MPRFFVLPEKISDESIIIDTEDAAHISRVLRLSVGDEITVCDEHGFDYLCVIEESASKFIRCRIKEKICSQSEPEIHVTLYQGIPKASKMDYIIQKTTELGICEITPCVLSRCVARIDGEKTEQKKLQRWSKIAEEAAKQSGRGIIPKISAPVTLDEAINRMKNDDLYFAPYECETQSRLKELIDQSGEARRISFIIGPEGGFAPEEIEKIKSAGINTITLGRRILRTETAGEAVLSMLMYGMGEI